MIIKKARVFWESVIFILIPESFLRKRRVSLSCGRLILENRLPEDHQGPALVRIIKSEDRDEITLFPANHYDYNPINKAIFVLLVDPEDNKFKYTVLDLAGPEPIEIIKGGGF